jgi:dATP pyrophosphohydrolase
MGYKRPVSVLVVIHTPEAQVLLIERAAQPGFWQSVTGSQEESDASLLRTAQREVREETGIAAPQSAFVDWRLSNTYEIYPAWRHRYGPGVSHNTEHVFSLCVRAGTPVRLSPREHRAQQWLDRLAAADACFSASNSEALLLLPRLGRWTPAL